MGYKSLALCGASALMLTALTSPAFAATAAAATTETDASSNTVQELVVTAQKREENINTVGLSIQAASGDRLQKLGVTDTASLVKLVPGFLATPNYYGTTVFTIRGVGFQDTSLGGSPTVSVYLDEAPLPYSALTRGTTLDLQRVEVLKGPQGTLFGENATGGAVNYIANKPTEHFEAGVNATYGRFNAVDIGGYVNVPLGNTLSARLAVKTEQGGAWQRSYLNTTSALFDPRYTPQPAGQTLGNKNFWNGRFSLLWKPTDKFKALLTINGWSDRSETTAGQLYGLATLSPTAIVAPAIKHYQIAPQNDQAANWNSCINNSPFDPLGGGGVNEGFNPDGTPALVYSGAQPTSCNNFHKNNYFFDATLRMDYEIGAGVTITSLTSIKHYTRFEPIDGDGINIQDYQSLQHGKISSQYQEFRLSGRFGDKGSWIVGANYEHDLTWDRFLQTYNASTASPTLIPRSAFCPLFGAAFGYTCTAAEAALPLYFGNATPVGGVNLGPTQPVNVQETNTYAAFANAEYPILTNLKLNAGVRYTISNKTYGGCGSDSGDGTWAEDSRVIQNLLEVLHGTITPSVYLADHGNGVRVAPGGCATQGFAPNFNPPPGGAFFTSKLDQHNVAWHAGLNWQATPDDLLYVNISKGYKGGSYPTVASASANQLVPVVQESLLAYEAGAKIALFDRTMRINGSAFYYAYKDKQVLGSLADPIFGALPALVNVPKSHVIGFEFSGSWSPEQLRGLTITPSVSYQFTKIDRTNRNTCSQSALSATTPGATCIVGDYYSYDAFAHYADFTGQDFPSVSKLQATVDAEYDWKLRSDLGAFVGVNVNYISSQHAFFSDTNPPAGSAYDPLFIKARTLVDLRAGITKGDLLFQLWGRNIFNTFYYNAADHVNDVLLRYTGLPATYGFTISYKFH